MKRVKLSESIFSKLTDSHHFLISNVKFSDLRKGMRCVRGNGFHDPGPGHIHKIVALSKTEAEVEITNVNTGVKDFDGYVIVPDDSQPTVAVD